MAIDNASFKDPFGSVFSMDGQIFRSIFRPGVESYEAARDNGVFESLIDKGLLVSHREIGVPEGAPTGSVYCLEHPRLPLISYP